MAYPGKGYSTEGELTAENGKEVLSTIGKALSTPYPTHDTLDLENPPVSQCERHENTVFFRLSLKSQACLVLR